MVLKEDFSSGNFPSLYSKSFHPDIIRPFKNPDMALSCQFSCFIMRTGWVMLLKDFLLIHKLWKPLGPKYNDIIAKILLFDLQYIL